MFSSCLPSLIWLPNQYRNICLFGFFLHKFQLTFALLIRPVCLSNGLSVEVIIFEPHNDEMVYLVVADSMVGAKDYESFEEDFGYAP